MAVACLDFFVPICTQSILFIRVIAVYPPRELTWSRRVLIYGTLSGIQLARLANAIVDFVKTAKMINKAPNFVVAEQVAWTLPYVKVEFILQLAYDV